MINSHNVFAHTPFLARVSPLPPSESIQDESLDEADLSAVTPQRKLTLSCSYSMSVAPLLVVGLQSHLFLMYISQSLVLVLYR